MVPNYFCLIKVVIKQYIYIFISNNYTNQIFLEKFQCDKTVADTKKFPSSIRFIPCSMAFSLDIAFVRNKTIHISRAIVCSSEDYFIPWICYERNFSEFYLSIWNQLVFNERLQLFVQLRQPYLLVYAWRKQMCFPNILVKKQMNIWISQNKSPGIEMLINLLC